MTNSLTSPGLAAIGITGLIIAVCFAVSLLAWLICAVLDWITGDLHPRRDYRQLRYDHTRKRWTPASRSKQRDD